MNKASNNLSKNNLPKTNSPNNSLKNNSQKYNSTISGNTRNTSSTNQSTGQSSSSTIGIVILIVIIFAIAASAYWLYNYYTTKTFSKPVDVELIPNIKDASGSSNLASSSIPNSSYSNEYSISCWVNVHDFDYKYGQEKVILRRGNSGSGNPEIVLDKKQNNLIVRVKLQNTGSGSGSGSISKFEDIPIQLPSQNVGLGFITPESVSEYGNASDNATSTMNNMTDLTNIPESFKKIGSNNIDYPTIHYTIDNNNPTNSGSASQCGYFDLISGNIVNTNPNVVQKNGNQLVEGFDNVSDAVNAAVDVVVDICNLAKTIQGQQFADDSVESLDNSFKSIIAALEASRTSVKSGADVNAAFSSLSSKISTPTQQSTTVISNQITKLGNDINTLSTFSTVQVDYKTVFNAINAKMSSMSCPLTFDSTTEVDGTISFYENMVNLLKKSLFTYINNMGSGIQKIYPELAGKQTASCLIDNSISTDPTVGTCIAKMIPLQKWINIIVSVYNQVIDIYIDGQLSSSCVLKGFPAISTEDVNVTPDGGFSGKISRVLFSNTAMTVGHAKEIYYNGPVSSTSLFSMIPNWVYWTILIVIIIAVGYSFLM